MSKRRSNLGSVRHDLRKAAGLLARRMGRRVRAANVRVQIYRSDDPAVVEYRASACPRSVITGKQIRETNAAKKCGYGAGRTPTAAYKSALQAMLRRIS